MYHHLNMGWGGSQDAWYNLPTIDTTPNDYDSVRETIYNILPSKNYDGEMVSGRVFDPNGEPLGVPADERTKRARIKAHSAFDALWKRKDMRRNDAYEWLACRLGLKRDDCHVGMFDFDMCQKVIEICSEVESETRNGDAIVRMPSGDSSPSLRHTILADALRKADAVRADGDRDSRLGLSRPS